MGGQTGQALNSYLIRFNLPTSSCAIINATACKPSGTKSAANFGKAVKACHGYFQDQLSKVPMTIPALLMGKWAAIALVGKNAFRGFIREIK